jgi:hypothetical protein
MRNPDLQNNGVALSPETGSTESLIAEIVDLAKAGLPRMFNPERQLFCNILCRDASGQLVQQGISHRYSMMTLLGLHRLETGGSTSPISIEPVMDVLTSDLGWVRYAGDLGVLLWLCAVVDPGRLESLGPKLNLRNALVRFDDARQGSTTELAWMLAGLAHAKLAAISSIPDLDGLSATVYGLLKANQGPYGIFGHLAAAGSLAGRLRGRAGCFADQVYPIYALAQFGQAYGDTEAIQCAQECAEAIVRLQGPQGEWWWHYDAATGRVSRPYPVYSVHQHGMAPMALLALEKVTNLKFSAAIARGLHWIPAENLLRFDMRYPEGGLVWRNIHLDSKWPQVQELLSLYLGSSPRPVLKNPCVAFECRPYELGWALYAFAPRPETGSRASR